MPGFGALAVDLWPSPGPASTMFFFYNKGLLIIERRLNGRGPTMGKPPLFYRACPADLANSDQNMTASITAQCHALTN